MLTQLAQDVCVSLNCSLVMMALFGAINLSLPCFFACLRVSKVKMQLYLFRLIAVSDMTGGRARAEGFHETFLPIKIGLGSN